ncbi:DUF262 domain-containing protein [Acidovorax sp. LjRoot194]|uniref:DUF262 domain-containing protein n=1 Tax=Acidovorax sp. LjRoot194 TaxID=3342280 RepID=UPI003ECE636F
MKIEESKHSIAELIDLYKRKDLTVNEEYQRAPRIWPPAARSYFIDTILSGYPFPKIYLWEQLNKATLRPQREIVDGQQRMTSIIDFRDNKFALTANSAHYSGKKFEDLTEDAQENFLTYTVSCDVIRNAQRAEILQMFRRMNAYTLPLNEAEKRHSEYFGAFKNWVNSLVDNWGQLFIEWKVLSSRAIVRMEDAEFITEIALAMHVGIVSTSTSSLKGLYKTYDDDFPESEEWGHRINAALQFIQTDLSGIQGSYMTKSYAFMSLITALIHTRWGLPGVQQTTGIVPTGHFPVNTFPVLTELLALASAHEMKDSTGRHKDYVEACKGGTNRVNQRLARFKAISEALEEQL